MPGTPELIALRGDAWPLRIAPSLGGSIVDACWHGRDVLRPMPDAELRARDVRESACYPRVPFSNRIALGACMPIALQALPAISANRKQA